jgi:hypothetical protein
MANSDFLIQSDYPMDKIVYITSGSIPIDGFPHTIPHGLPFVPLLGGYWSLTPDFAICYEFFSGDFPSGNAGYFFAHEVDILADATNVQLDTVDIAGGSKTAYYRVYGFEPSDSAVEITTPVGGDSFNINSDYNYMKLFMSGVVNPGTVSTYTIDHNLGYIPQVHAWYTWLGDCVPMVRAGDTSSGQIMIQVTPTQIIMSNLFNLAVTRLDYRIYLDA